MREGNRRYSKKHRPLTLAVLLAVLVAVVVGARVAAIPRHRALEHDEAISYLHAAGKSGALDSVRREAGAPYGQWATAAAWQRFLRPDGFDPAAAYRATRDYDRHPPLYFVLLNAGVAALGYSRDSALWLAIPGAVFIALLVFAVTWRLTDDPFTATLAGIVWALLPGALDTGLTVRQYELLALGSTLVLWTTHRLAEEERLRPVDLAAFAAGALLGLASHVYALIPVSGAVVWLVLTGRDRWRRAGIAAGVAAASLALSVAVTPGAWFLAGSTSKEGAGGFGQAASARWAVLTTMLQEALGFGREPRIAAGDAFSAIGIRPALGLAAVALLGLVGIALSVRAWHRAPGEPASRLRRGAVAFFFLAWNTVPVVAAFLLVPALSSAAGPRYLAMTWPVLAVCLGVLSAAALRKPWVLVAIVAAYLAFANVALSRNAPVLTPEAYARGARHVVFDNVARGVVLPWVDVTEPSVPVYAAWRDRLVASPDAWLGRLQPGDVVVTTDLYQPGDASTQRLLGVIKTSFAVAEEPARGLRGRVWRLSALESTPTP